MGLCQIPRSPLPFTLLKPFKCFSLFLGLNPQSFTQFTSLWIVCPIDLWVSPELRTSLLFLPAALHFPSCSYIPKSCPFCHPVFACASPQAWNTPHPNFLYIWLLSVHPSHFHVCHFHRKLPLNTQGSSSPFVCEHRSNLTTLITTGFHFIHFCYH